MVYTATKNYTCEEFVIMREMLLSGSLIKIRQTYRLHTHTNIKYLQLGLFVLFLCG